MCEWLNAEIRKISFPTIFIFGAITPLLIHTYNDHKIKTTTISESMSEL